MRTALYERHLQLGAKMVDFCGWEMPLHYNNGIIAEHKAVRDRVGIFDVSHMGRIFIEGPQAEPFVDFLSTNKILGKPDLSATYTIWSAPSGGTVDDVIVYKKDLQRYFAIVNAANREKDLLHVKEQAKPFHVQISDGYQEQGILAIQGPKALELVAALFPQASEIRRMHFGEASYRNREIVLSATGYTGAGGFEIYGPNEALVELWDQFLKRGAEPIGLGARDTLRLEMGYALYGHELSDSISVNESVSSWALKITKGDFLGKEALQRVESSLKKRFAYGISLVDKGIAREGYPVLREGQQIGIVTSGTHSPTLNHAIALILVGLPLQIGDLVEVQIRKHLAKAEVVPFPFINTRSTE